MSYKVGQHVYVSAREHEGHHRTPGYAKGQTVTVERIHGSFPNPETRAYGTDGLPGQTLYFVSFAEGADRIYLDVFEHWLEEA
jgi:hypothetical protein